MERAASCDIESGEPCRDAWLDHHVPDRRNTIQLPLDNENATLQSGGVFGSSLAGGSAGKMDKMGTKCGGSRLESGRASLAVFWLE